MVLKHSRIQTCSNSSHCPCVCLVYMSLIPVVAKCVCVETAIYLVVMEHGESYVYWTVHHLDS